jgi:AraC-like DNA-binding protein
MATTRYYKSVVMQYGISHFYCFKKDHSINNTLVAVPDGCIDIQFCCDDQKPYAEICGTVLRPRKIHHEGNGYYFGVRFQPGKGYQNKKIKFAELVEQEAPFLEVTGDKELFERITSSRDFKDQIRVFLAKYLSYNDYSETDNKFRDLSEFMLKEIMRTAGQVKVKELAEATGYSVRYINKVFTDELGVSPKVFCKLMRFQHLLNNLNDEEADLVQLAIKLGYYDQSHMIKDFNECTNTTPGKYLYFLKETQYKKRLFLVNH